IINHGLINASTGGSVTLLGSRVENHGLISANLGSVNLAAGREAVLTFDRMGLLGVKVTRAVLQEDLGVDPAVLNTGQISAAGGTILLTGSVTEDIFSQAVNMGDNAEAREVVVHEDGSFTLFGGAEGAVNAGIGGRTLLGTNVGSGANVVNTGTLDVSATAEGMDAGEINVFGENITNSGRIVADSMHGNGGDIELQAAVTTQLIEDSYVSAISYSPDGVGGDIRLLGHNVGLFDNTIVDASGGHGGQVLIGGDERGLNPYVRNARFTFLGENTQVFADGNQLHSEDLNSEGNGGRVIVFAEDTSRIYGNLSARGGRHGGNGGFIETSGLRGFFITATPDVTAANGLGGEWLIDPYNIEIVNGGGNTDIGSSNPFESTDDDATLGVNLIEAALVNGANVTITTGAGGAQDGNITISGDLNLNDRTSWSLPATLTLNAHNDIIVTGRIYDSSDIAGQDITNLIFNAGFASSFDGDISIYGEIESAGGNIEFNGNNFIFGDGSNVADIKSFGGNITLNANGTIFQHSNSDFTSSGGNFLAFGTSIDLDGGVDITGGTGYVYMSASAGALDVGRITTDGGTGDSGDTGVIGENIQRGSVTLRGQSVSATNAIDTTGGDDTAGGDINIVATSGSISVANLTSDGGNATNNDNAGLNAGDITLTATSGITVTGNISAQGSNGDDTTNNDIGQNGGVGGAISLSTSSGAVAVSGTINSSGGDADGRSSNDEGNGGNAGGINLSGDSVSVAAITADGGSSTGDDNDGSRTGGNANTISITANSGNLTLTGNVSAQGGADSETNTGNGANIILNGPVVLAADNIAINASGNTSGDICFADACSTPSSTSTVNGNGSNAGNLTLTGNNILLAANVGATNAVGDLIINATGNVDATGNSIAANSLNVQNSVSFTSGDINTSGGANGGDVTIASQDIVVGAINTSGTTSGGNITLTATDNNASGTPSITLNGDLDSRDTTDASNDGTIAMSLNGSSTPLGSFIINFISDFTSALTVTGSGGVDTLTAANRTNTWVINSSNSTLNSSLTFNAFENFIGNSGVDTFTVNGTASSIDAGAGNNNITVNSSGTVSGTITTGDNDDTIAIAGTVNAVVAGNGTNGITVNNGGSVATSITGGTGVDTIVLADVGSATVGSIAAGDGNNNITVNTGGVVSGTVTTGDNDDTIAIAGTVNAIVAGNG
ncbi:MAG: hypothetical protein OQK04_07870, partial [Kangiellaceae bacterium]|nr:hypothetical protein [Kangiellaceae bacterium]